MRASPLLLLLLAVPLRADKPFQPDRRINDLLTPIRAKHKVPGLAAAVVRGDKLAGVGAVGVRKNGSPEALTVHDKMHLGSCTKAMTATMLARLVEQKKLSWDSTLGQVFADLDRMHPDFRRVPLHQLLAHRAGLRPDVVWALLGFGRPTPVQRRQLLQEVLTRPPEAKPGAKELYSNVGYVVAGAMAEKVTGRSWEELMRQEVFGPLGMTLAGFGPPGSEETVQQPWGHERDEGRFVPLWHDNPPVMGPAGTVHASLADWAKLAAAHLQGARGKDGLLRAETFLRLQAPAKGEEYAGGWVVKEPRWAGTRVLLHNGSNTLWYALVVVIPERNLAILTATNVELETGDRACWEVVHALFKEATAKQ